MSRGVVLVLIVVFALAWFAYSKYGVESTVDFVDDIQAYQDRSLLPEDD